MKTIMSLLLITSLFLLTSCASAPSNGKTNRSALTDDTTTSSEELKSSLMRGDNNLTEGYSLDATLLTEALIRKQEIEKGAKNMDSDETIKKNIQTELSLIKNNTCFSINVSTYSLEQSSFKNWVAKIKNNLGQITDVTLRNVSGVESVPTPYKDLHGRDWHNNTLACTKKIDQIELGFTVYLIPQWKTNGKDGKSELIWTFE